MKLRDDVLLEPVSGEESVALDLSDHRFYSLNETATRVLELLSGGVSADDIPGTIAEEFEISLAEATADVQEFLDSLRKRSLLVE